MGSQSADAALAGSPHQADAYFYQGKLQALKYFYRFELPQINSWAKILSDLDSTCYDMKTEWF
ncbi:MAG: acyl-CoA dehydrogenase C-terminal domain-containing protein [Oceanicoccus sp.]